MGMQVRFTMNNEGIRDLLRSPGVKAMLESKARAVASQAQSNAAAAGKPEIEILVEDHTGKNRARYRVVADHPAAKPLEAATRFLGRAVDAARGG